MNVPPPPHIATSTPPRRPRGARPALGAILVAIAVLASAWSAPGASAAGDGARAADTVLRDGYVYTVDRHDPVARALAIENGEIVYVGGDQGVGRFIGPKTQVIDLHGRMVMPGLVDAHLHEVMKGAQPTCDLEAKPLTVAEFRAKITACLENPKLHTSIPGAKNDFLPVDNFYIQFLRPAGTEATKELFAGLTTGRSSSKRRSPAMRSWSTRPHSTWPGSPPARPTPKAATFSTALTDSRTGSSPTSPWNWCAGWSRRRRRSPCRKNPTSPPRK